MNIIDDLKVSAGDLQEFQPAVMANLRKKSQVVFKVHLQKVKRALRTDIQNLKKKTSNEVSILIAESIPVPDLLNYSFQRPPIKITRKTVLSIQSVFNQRNLLLLWERMNGNRISQILIWDADGKELWVDKKNSCLNRFYILLLKVQSSQLQQLHEFAQHNSTILLFCPLTLKSLKNF